MDRVSHVQSSYGNGSGSAGQPVRGQEKKEKWIRAEGAAQPRETAGQYSDGQRAGQYGQRQDDARKKDYQESGNSIIDQLRAQAQSVKDAFDPKKKKNLYDATMDLMLVAQAEKPAALKAIQTRLLFKIRSVRASGAEDAEIRAAVSKLKKVIGKAKAKVKNLQKEEQLEKKRKKAEENKRKAREEAIRRELELRKKIRKVKERGDIEESKMGLGANYGGPEGNPYSSPAASAYGSTGTAAPVIESGAVMDMAVADMGTGAADAAAGAVDVSL